MMYNRKYIKSKVVPYRKKNVGPVGGVPQLTPAQRLELQDRAAQASAMPSSAASSLPQRQHPGYYTSSPVSKMQDILQLAVEGLFSNDEENVDSLVKSMEVPKMVSPLSSRNSDDDFQEPATKIVKSASSSSENIKKKKRASAGVPKAPKRGRKQQKSLPAKECQVKIPNRRTKDLAPAVLPVPGNSHLEKSQVEETLTNNVARADGDDDFTASQKESLLLYRKCMRAVQQEVLEAERAVCVATAAVEEGETKIGRLTQRLEELRVEMAFVEAEVNTIRPQQIQWQNELADAQKKLDIKRGKWRRVQPDFLLSEGANE